MLTRNLFFIFACLGLVASSSEAVRIKFNSSQQAIFEAEVVQTPDKIEMGLMFRKSMPKKSGMLFLFPKEEIRYFWMKNTLIQLDMIFMDSHKKIIGIIYNAQPEKLDLLSVYKPSQYVLEMNAGQAKKYKLQVGVQASW